MSAQTAGAAVGMRRALEAARDALADGRAVVLIGRASHQLEQARAQCRAMCRDLVGPAGTRVFHSRSATPGRAAVAACIARPVGIDIQEVVAADVDDAVLDLALHPEERLLLGDDRYAGFVRLWTRKEAILKALGTGLAIAPHVVRAGLSQGWQDLVLCGRRIHVRDLEHARTHCASVAALEAAPPLCVLHVDLLGRD